VALGQNSDAPRMREQLASTAMLTGQVATQVTIVLRFRIPPAGLDANRALA
jgi:hypothetical protein